MWYSYCKYFKRYTFFLIGFSIFLCIRKGEEILRHIAKVSERKVLHHDWKNSYFRWKKYMEKHFMVVLALTLRICKRWWHVLPIWRRKRDASHYIRTSLYFIFEVSFSKTSLQVILSCCSDVWSVFLLKSNHVECLAFGWSGGNLVWNEV